MIYIFNKILIFIFNLNQVKLFHFLSLSTKFFDFVFLLQLVQVLIFSVCVELLAWEVNCLHFSC